MQNGLMTPQSLADSHAPSPGDLPVLDLTQQTRLTTEQWYWAKCTTKAYSNYIKAGKTWLANDIAARQSALEDSATQEEKDEVATMADAFETITDQTCSALRLFIAFKCEYEKCKFTTVEGICSAFKDYFEQ
jgi:hypothetical protein